MKRIALVFALALVAAGANAAEPTSAELLKQANKKGLAQRINLREYDATKRLYQRAIATAKDAYEKANATIDYARFEWRCAKDDQPEKWRKMERDAWTTAAKATVQQRYALLDKNIDGLDWKTEADKLFAEDPKTGHQYWNGLLARPPSVFSGVDWTLEVCEKALADKNLTINRWLWQDKKATALVRLGRENEAIAWCDAELAATKANGNKGRADWLCRKARIFTTLSARYYDAREPKAALKAITYYYEALGCGANERDTRRAIVGLALDIGELATAKKELAKLASVEKTPSDWTLTRQGDVAYREGNYKAAAGFYGQAKKIDEGQDHAKPSSRRYAESLEALGRYEEALKAIDGMANWMSNRDINESYRKAIKARIAAGGKTVETDERLPARKPYDPKRFRLMCYNIRVGAGAETWNAAYKPGELRGLPRVARTICEAQADFACLQEVNQFADDTGGIDQPAYLAEQTGLVATYREKVSRGQGSYGLALLSPVAPIASRPIFLPKGKDHIRICLVSEFDGFVIATSHLSGQADIQRQSAELIIKELAQYKKPVFFTGDLNAKPSSDTIALLKTHFKLLSDPSRFTCHSLNPGECLDYIFVDRAHADQVSASGYTVGTSTASDHFPIWIDIAFAD